MQEDEAKKSGVGDQEQVPGSSIEMSTSGHSEVTQQLAESLQDIATIKKRVSEIYIKERKAGNRVDPISQIYPIFDGALEQDATNIDLWIEYIVTMERNKEPLNKIVEMFERALSVPFEAGEHFRRLWFSYIDCQRRHTDWENQKEVESLDRSFDTCAQYLSRIPNADPELSVLKYWAMIQAKYLNRIDDARRTWYKISQEQGLEYAKTAKFWLEFAEFERVFGGDDIEEYRKLLYRALQKTNDFPELLGERLVVFERQEGDTVEKAVEAQQRLDQAVERIKVKKKLEGEKINQKKEAAKEKKKKKKSKGEKRPPESDGISISASNDTSSKKLKTENNTDTGQTSTEAHDTPSTAPVNTKPQGFFMPRTLMTKKKS